MPAPANLPPEYKPNPGRTNCSAVSNWIFESYEITKGQPIPEEYIQPIQDELKSVGYPDDYIECLITKNYVNNCDDSREGLAYCTDPPAYDPKQTKDLCTDINQWYLDNRGGSIPSYTSQEAKDFTQELITKYGYTDDYANCLMTDPKQLISDCNNGVSTDVSHCLIGKCPQREDDYKWDNFYLKYWQADDTPNTRVGCGDDRLKGRTKIIDDCQNAQCAGQSAYYQGVVVGEGDGCNHGIIPSDVACPKIGEVQGKNMGFFDRDYLYNKGDNFPILCQYDTKCMIKNRDQLSDFLDKTINNSNYPKEITSDVVNSTIADYCVLTAYEQPHECMFKNIDGFTCMPMFGSGTDCSQWFQKLADSEGNTETGFLNTMSYYCNKPDNKDSKQCQCYNATNPMNPNADNTLYKAMVSSPGVVGGTYCWLAPCRPMTKDLKEGVLIDPTYYNLAKTCKPAECSSIVINEGIISDNASIQSIGCTGSKGDMLRQRWVCDRDTFKCKQGVVKASQVDSYDENNDCHHYCQKGVKPGPVPSAAPGTGDRGGGKVNFTIIAIILIVAISLIISGVIAYYGIKRHKLKKLQSKGSV